MVSSVESLIPLFLIRISLSSIRQQMFSTAEPLAKILEGSSAESPYALFFSNNKSLTAFAVLRIFVAELFICLVFNKIYWTYYTYLVVNVRIGLGYMQIMHLLF